MVLMALCVALVVVGVVIVVRWGDGAPVRCADDAAQPLVRLAR
jgi:hypothetical protein